jgi:hypothetical protein
VTLSPALSLALALSLSLTLSLTLSLALSLSLALTLALTLSLTLSLTLAPDGAALSDSTGAASSDEVSLVLESVSVMRSSSRAKDARRLGGTSGLMSPVA